MGIAVILILVLFSTDAQAAPVVAAGAAVFGFFTGGGIGSIIGSLLLSAAFTAVSTLLTRSNATGTAAQAQPEQRLSTRQSIPARRYVLGEVLCGGALGFEECKPPWLYMMLLISQGPIEALLWVQVNQTRINVNPVNGNALTSPYTNNLYVRFANGDVDQVADSQLLSDFPELTSNFRQRGIARVVIRAYFGNDQDHYVLLWGQQQKPNVILNVRGIRAYDPRDATQFLPANPNDKEQYDAAYASWKWTDNATLIETHFLWDQDFGRYSPHDIVWSKIADSANYDDGMIYTKSGEFIKRHTINGVVTTDQEPYSVLEQMCRSNRAIICRSEGKVWVQSSQPRQPTMTITDNHIVGGVSYRRSRPKQELVRRLKVRFVDPRQEWAMVDGPIRTNADWDGRYEGTLELPFTVDYRRAQRLQTLAMLEAELGRQIVTMLSIQSLSDAEKGELVAGTVIRFQSGIVSRANGIYRIEDCSFVENFAAIQVTLKEYDPAIESAYNPATDEQDFTLPPLIDTEA